MNINLHIERLVLEGLNIDQAQRGLVQAALETELTRLLLDGGLAPELHAGVAMPEVSVGPARISRDERAPKVGQAIARAVYGGIGK